MDLDAKMPPIPENSACPKELQDLIAKCLTKEMAFRPTLDMLKMVFYNELD
jgi:hypothetical protein